MTQKLKKNRNMPRKWVFEPNMVKNDPTKPPKWANFWPQFSILRVIYQPFEPKIQSKVGLLRPKTMPKQLF